MRTAPRELLLIFTIATLAAISPTDAKKPDNTGGGGGGDPAPPVTEFVVLDLGIDATPEDMNDGLLDGIITVAMSTGSTSPAAYAYVDSDTRAVVDVGLLPQPTEVEESDANGTNELAEIVGVTYYNSRKTRRALFWSPGTDGYTYELLPQLEGFDSGYAWSINNLGEIVGGVDDADNGFRAVLWEADTHNVVDLNTPATQSLGWELWFAYAINDAGCIVGNGYFNGVWRGYVLDLATGAISAVPLVGTNTKNIAHDISETNQIIGDSSDAEGDASTRIAYAWDGPGADPSIMLSLADLGSTAFSLNDLGATVGFSYASSEWGPRGVATIWEPDGEGGHNAAEIVPDNSKYDLHTTSLMYTPTINNLGWVSALAERTSRGKSSRENTAVLLLPMN